MPPQYHFHDRHSGSDRLRNSKRSGLVDQERLASLATPDTSSVRPRTMPAAHDRVTSKPTVTPTVEDQRQSLVQHGHFMDSSHHPPMVAGLRYRLDGTFDVGQHPSSKGAPVLPGFQPNPENLSSAFEANTRLSSS